MSGVKRPRNGDEELKPPEVVIRSKKARTEKRTLEELFDTIGKASDSEELDCLLKELKNQLTNVQGVEFMVRAEKTALLLELLSAQVARIGKTDYKDECLRLIAGCLANCCNFSTAICLEIKRQQQKIAPLIVRILESISTSLRTKSSIMRMVANVVAHKESAQLASGSGFLMDLVCQLLDSEHCELSKQALRVVKGLVNSNLSRYCLLSNVGYYMGRILKKQLKEENLDAEVWRIIDKLSHRFAKDIGRQIASSECMDVLLEQFFSSPQSEELAPAANWGEKGEDSIGLEQRTLITLATASHDFREKLGESNIIEKIVDMDAEASSTNLTSNSRLLASMTQDAWGRAALREKGGMEYLVKRLSDSDLLDERLIIVNSFRHFIHDTLGMAKMAHIKLFVDTVIRDVNNYIDENIQHCQTRINLPSFKPSVADVEQPKFFIGAENSDSSKNKEEVVERLHKDFHSMWNYNVTSPVRSFQPSPTYSMSSPVYSRESSFSSPPRNYSPVASPESSMSHSSDVFDLMLSPETEEASSGSRLEKRKIQTQKHIVEGELWLLIYHAQDDQNMLQLLREDLIACVLSYLCLTHCPDRRAYRILHRMAASRAALESLLSMQFHIRVLDSLCSPPCRMTKFAAFCERCERNAELGREILREFAAHVDSDFGHHFLVRSLTSEDFLERLTAAIAKVTLIRDQFRSALRLSQGHRTAMDVLFESLEVLLSKEEMKEERSMRTYENGPPLCAQIIGALSTLLSVQRIRGMLDAESYCIYNPPETDGTCHLEQDAKNEKCEMITFFNKENGSELAKVPLDKLVERSKYFEGMFTADLIEKTSTKREFVFDALVEGCSASDFVLFLHLLSSCTAKCIAINSAESCVNMLELADRYLCPDISEFLCASDGPSRRWMDGESLVGFLPIALVTNTHSGILDSAFLILMRYSNSRQLMRTLNAVAKSQLLREAFFAKFRAFIMQS